MNQTSKRIQYTLPDGTQAYFSRYNLKTSIHRSIVSCGKKITQQVFLEEMADATGNSFSAIKHWIAGHNAPSDLDKLQAIADFLKVNITDLLETEKESKAMANTVMPIKAVDFSETKNTIRDLYIRMVDYIEMFRALNVNHVGGEERTFEDLAEVFPNLYTAILHARLDLPTTVFNDLSSFTSNYLQQMFCYLMFCTVATDEFGCFPEEINTPDLVYGEYSADFGCNPWFDILYVSVDHDCKDGQLFANAVKNQYLWDNNDEENFTVWMRNELITDAAYTRLGEILKDYLVC